MSTTSTTRATQRNSRLSTRLTPEQKALFEHAARVSGQSLTQFVLAAARQAAEQIIQQHEVIVLSVRDSQAVMAALAQPPSANDALRQAAAFYREAVHEAQDER